MSVWLRVLTLLMAGAVCLGSVGCESSTVTSLQGSGATFPVPVYKRWFLEYYKQHPDIQANYTPIGSGAGIRQFTAGLVSFGASDAGMNKKEVAALPEEYGGVVLLPLTAGCVVLSYNLPEVTEPLRLSRENYLDIFDRRIVRWNDERLQASNPGVALPDRPITVITRAESSGTTYVFTQHLTAIAKADKLAWGPGTGKTVRWAEAIAAQGNDGVASLIQLTPGAIGYLEYSYSRLAKLPTIALQNSAGCFVPPDDAGVGGGYGLEGAVIPSDLQIIVTDPPHPQAYPIVTYTWVMCRQEYPSEREAEAIRKLMLFCLEDRQQDIAVELGFLRLPGEVQQRARQAVASIRGPRE